MKSIAKMVDEYAERVNTISGGIAEGEMLDEVRKNLQKLREQLGESRTVLNTAGELLLKSIEGYTNTESRQVKKVDAMKAHNRDFYKQPIVVASAGGAVVAATASATATVNSITEAPITEIIAEAPMADVRTEAAVTPDSFEAAPSRPISVQTNEPLPKAEESSTLPNETPAIKFTTAERKPSTAPAAKDSTEISEDAVKMSAGAAAGISAAGGAAAVGAALGGVQLKKQYDKKKQLDRELLEAEDLYDPDAELEAALQRAREAAAKAAAE